MTTLSNCQSPEMDEYVDVDVVAVYAVPEGCAAVKEKHAPVADPASAGNAATVAARSQLWDVHVPAVVMARRGLVRSGVKGPVAEPPVSVKPPSVHAGEDASCFLSNTTDVGIHPASDVKQNSAPSVPLTLAEKVPKL